MPPDDDGGRRPGTIPTDRHHTDPLPSRVTHQRNRWVCHWPAIDPLAVAALVAWVVTR